MLLLQLLLTLSINVDELLLLLLLLVQSQLLKFDLLNFDDVCRRIRRRWFLQLGRCHQILVWKLDRRRGGDPWRCRRVDDDHDLLRLDW